MPGLRGRATHTITDADTAVALRSGEVQVLGTPRLVALREEAPVQALDGALAAGEPRSSPGGGGAGPAARQRWPSSGREGPLRRT